jgi:metal-responsive CopG/Arc/MetJ family transcriptional regulator
MKKEKAISLRLSQELYQKYVNKAIQQSNKEKRLIAISEIIRKTLEDNI